MLSNIQEQRADASPDAGCYGICSGPAHAFLLFDNLTAWGLGLPLGILAWAGFLWMGWRMLKGEWRQHIVLWSWTAIYSSGSRSNTTEHALPVAYLPVLAMIAAWAVFDWARPPLSSLKRLNWRLILASTVGIAVLVLTFAWAYAFTRIYLGRKHASLHRSGFIKMSPGPSTCRFKPRQEPLTSNPCLSRPAVLSKQVLLSNGFYCQADGV